MSDLIIKAIPWLASALLGPAGGLAADFLGKKLGLAETTVESVKNALSGMTPEQLLAVKDHEAEWQFKMQELGYKQASDMLTFDLGVIKEVNATMRAEIENSDKEAWYQKGWRPANGFAVAIGSLFGVVMACTAYILCIFYGKPEAFAQVPVLAGALAAILAVPGAAVGISAWHRGMAQREEIANGNGH